MPDPTRSRLLRLNASLGSLVAGADPAHILDAILDHALDLTATERAFVVTPDDSGTLRLRASRDHRVDKQTLDWSRTVVARALEQGRPLVVGDARLDPALADAKSVQRLALRSSIVAPLASNSRLVGAIVVDNLVSDRRLTEEDAFNLGTLVPHAVLALERLEEREASALASERLHRAQLADFPLLVGASPAMKKLREEIALAARTDATVLIQGETGTGKELVARSLHEHGKRKARRFVPTNLANVTETVAESALFGHVKGAFTGASNDHAGLFREAHKGTLFLDEIGEATLPIQAKLLRAIEERRVRPLGGEETKVDVRFLAATNRDLRERCKRGEFREDLFHRLNVFPISVPPLRERAGDALRLAQHFLLKLALLRKEKARRLSRDAQSKLEKHDFPGNVRELEHAIERATLRCKETIHAQDLDLEGTAHATPVFNLDEIEGDRIVRAMEHSGGSVPRAAKLLGMGESTLYRKLGKLGRKRRGSPQHSHL